MLMRPASREYGPDLVALMSEALESAWLQVPKAPRDAELARLVMASAILEQIDAGVRVRDQLVASAANALAAAARFSGAE